MLRDVACCGKEVLAKSDLFSEACFFHTINIHLSNYYSWIRHTVGQKCVKCPHQSEFSLLNSMILGMHQWCCKDDNDNDDTPEICGCGEVARVSHLPVHHCPFRQECNAECYSSYRSSLTVGMMPLLLLFSLVHESTLLWLEFIVSSTPPTTSKLL